ncbi:DNA helicase/exodeoxyribonuclease V, subunit A [Loktanella fryxellensis]|uniref:DNA 3'-5' helicase n=1 Tax=Loktanella fryxellensis TaxID=245187 RepID=A0A1H8DYJ7_9RHOB|nr:double-strand break repair helicase AddA [Loktanella fryxellensis]SEN12255.1 DNA helicase/exodeoxyribonuclease V, subunit A [Loktanella fryxellensis]
MTRDAATQNQVTAADPTVSTWLSANAGSGKTRVLTDRVARLLLENVSPQNILCLTYTKAAAAEMQNRLFKRLGGWAMLDDASLRRDLATLGVEGTIPPDTLAAARRLFARAIETPGGLKIQTIHSFCASVLRRFPLEAQISPGFREIEDRTAAILRAEVLDDMAGGDAAHLLTGVLRHLGGSDLDSLVRDITGQAPLFARPVDEDALRDALDIAPGRTLAALLTEVFNEDTREIVRDLIVACRTGGTMDNKAAGKLADVNLTVPTASDLIALEGVFLFGETAKAPFGPKTDSFPTKAVRAAHPDLTDALVGLMETVADLRSERLSLMALDRSTTLHRFAHDFLTRYAAAKAARGVLDFDDLIAKARGLLSDKSVAAWVLFRLDGGIDHLLVDEAQDTSPAQWAVVQHLTREFVSGDSARDVRRTVFVVGDKKQSIYSFQGADPAEFDRMRAYFDRALGEIDDPLQSRTLAHSFRSSLAILRVVDATFQRERAAGLGDASQHIPFFDAMPGRVDLWPVIDADTTKEDPDANWLSPVDEVSATHHLVQLADRVAAQITRMIRHETLPVHTKDGWARRPVRAGDLLILVQGRQTLLFPELIRACKAAGLPIAGADVLRVGGELAVRDIAALLRFLALPEDDLSLAAALRSPLFGWSEQDLFTLAHHRADGAFLWSALRESAAHADTMAVIDDLLSQADFLRPYDLIARLLVRHGGRQRLLARLGSEAEDGIDALLAQALAYESDNVPSLTGFLAWMDTDDLTVKRQMDAQGDRIRVMTVHGAKGLEAPIVILPDAAERANLVRAQVLPGDPPLWKSAKADQPPAMAARVDAMVAAQARERLRLLYVAMTRAERWLIVAAAGEVGTSGTAWHDIVREGMEHAAMVDAMSGDLSVQRVEHGEWDAGAVLAHVSAPHVPQVAEVLDPLPPIVAPRTVSPSDLGGAKVVPGGVEDDDNTARLRGTLFHMLLEHLPALPHDQRAPVAARLIAAKPEADGIPTADLIADALALIDAPHLAALYSTDTLGEVGITADLPCLGRMNGSIDRLIVTPDRVTAVDFKTNRLTPDTPEQVPDGLLRQMGAYAAALAQVYPDRQIATAILWTRSAVLMDLPPALTTAALDRARQDPIVQQLHDRPASPRLDDADPGS